MIEDNVIHRGKCDGFCLRHENFLVNNIVVDVRVEGYVWTDDRWPLDGSRIVGNIFFHSGDGPWYYTMAEHEETPEDVYRRLGEVEQCEVERNIYCAAEGADEVLRGLREYGGDENGVADAALFMDLEHGDYRLREDSPARKLGIVSIDVSEMGLTDALPRWKTCP